MNRPKKQEGFTLIETMVVVLLVGLLAAIAVPNFIRSRTTAQTNACINNLKAIDYAIQQWALEQKKAASAPVQFTDISGYLRNSVTCPAGGASFSDSYLITKVGEEPTCTRVPGAHLILQLAAQLVSSSEPSGTGDSSGSPTSNGGTGSPTPAPGSEASPGSGPSAGNPNSHANNGNGNNGNGNGLGNGGIGNGNGNGNVP